MTDDIRLVLRDLALDAPEGPETLAADAWDGGKRLRRRRSATRIALAAAATVAVCGAVVVALPGAETTNLPAAPPTSVARHPVNFVLPERLEQLPFLGAGFPERVDIVPESAEALAKSPMRRALALFQRNNSVFALGDDGRVRALGRLPITHTSLSADGRTAVFPDVDGVHVVDLTTGTTRTVPVPGEHLHAAISPDGTQLLVTSRQRGTVLVDATTGTMIISWPQKRLEMGFSATEKAAYAATNDKNRPAVTVWTYRANGTGTALDYPMDSLVDEIRGIPVARNGRVAWAGSGKHAVRDVIVVSSWEPGTGSGPTLGLPSPGVRPLRWLDDSTLLLLSEGVQSTVVSWNIDTGAIHRVMELERPGLLAM